MKFTHLICLVSAFIFIPIAEGAVIYQEPNSFIGGPEPVEFDLDQNGTTDLSFFIRRSPIFVFGVSGPLTTSILRDQLGGFTQVSVRPPGFLLGDAESSNTYYYPNFTRPDGGFQLSSRCAVGDSKTLRLFCRAMPVAKASRDRECSSVSVLS